MRASDIKVTNIKEKYFMAKNLYTALHRWPIKSNTVWMDSMVALYWITNPWKGWKVFVANRVKKIAETIGPISII